MFFLKLLKLNPIPNLAKAIKSVKFYTETEQASLKPISMAFVTYESNNGTTSGTPAFPVIIMHGLFGSKRNWNSLSKVLKEKTVPQRKVIAVDCRNHGNSPRTDEHSYPHLTEDIKALIQKLEIEKAALLGHSMGGRAMMYFALKYPKFVEKLIVVDISPVSSSAKFTSMTTIFAAVEQVKLPKIDIPIAAARKHCDRQLVSSIANKDIRAFLLSSLEKGPSGNYIWNVNIKAIINNFSDNIHAFPETHGLRFDCPVLFISGEKSDYIRKSNHSDILKIFPKAEFTVIKEAGHWVHVDKPVQFLKVCIEFLNKEIVENY